MTSPRSQISQWRLILRKYLEENPGEKNRVAKMLDTTVRSVERWIADGSTTAPERSKVPKLALMVTGKEHEMELSLRQDYPKAFERPVGSEIMPNIPAQFILRPLEAYATTARHLNRSSIMSMVFRQMVSHLDPYEEGMAVLFAQCIPPTEPGGQVTGLSVHTPGHGTSPWHYQQFEKPYIVGSGSLSAMAIYRGDIALYPQDVYTLDYISPILYSDEIQEHGSCAAYPVLREGDTAGALFLVSKQREFFTETRRLLIKQYATFFALAIRDNEFYPISRIQLQPMPSLPHQNTIYVESQQFLEDLRKQYPNDTPEQVEARARQIFNECLEIIKEREMANGK